MSDRLDRILALALRQAPGLRLVCKQDVGWMRIAGIVLRPFVPDFMTHYTTVMGSTVYLPRPPAQMARDSLAAILAHELVHLVDQRRYGVVFYVTYALALPAGRSLRAVWERRAYAVDLLLARERGGVGEVERVAERLAGLFAGPAYLWMWSPARGARRFLRPTVDAVVEGDLDAVEPYRSILEAWRADMVGPDTQEDPWARPRA